MARSNLYVRGTPRRRVEKIVSVLSRNITNVVSDATLYAADEPCTLVRTIMQLEVRAAEPGLSLAFLLQLSPQGNIIELPQIAEALGLTPGKTWMWHHIFINSAIAAEVVKEVHVDMGGMRKMSKGDELTLSMISSAAGPSPMVGTATMFFKE